MNKLTILAAGLTAALTGFAAPTAFAADATGTGNATIAVPIGVSAVNTLEFGSVQASASLGTVAISAAGARSVTGGVTEFGGTLQAASFNVTGEGTSTYSISVADGTLTGSGGADMAVSSFTNDAGATPALTGGTDTFNLGGTLSVAANQGDGAYSGTFVVTVDYQ
jgi:hypothetical protein